MKTLGFFNLAMRGCRHGVTLCGLLFALNAFAATPPAITTQPASQTVLSGSNATFSVAASTGTTLSYQWYFNSVLIKGATNTPTQWLKRNIQMPALITSTSSTPVAP